MGGPTAIEVTTTPDFTELSSGPIALRVPPATSDPPHWARMAVAQVHAYHVHPQMPDVGPLHRIPVGDFREDPTGVPWTDFLVAVHPSDPDRFLIVGLTETERRHSDEGPAALLELLIEHDPHLVTDPARGDRFEDPSFAQAFTMLVSTAPSGLSPGALAALMDTDGLQETLVEAIARAPAMPARRTRSGAVWVGRLTIVALLSGLLGLLWLFLAP